MLAAGAARCATPSQVPWFTYGPGPQDEIDSAAQDRDCATLAALHDTAKKTSQSHEKATGFPNDALIDYISEAAKGAGCDL